MSCPLPYYLSQSQQRQINDYLRYLSYYCLGFDLSKSSLFPFSLKELGIKKASWLNPQLDSFRAAGFSPAFLSFFSRRSCLVSILSGANCRPPLPAVQKWLT